LAVLKKLILILAVLQGLGKSWKTHRKRCWKVVENHAGCSVRTVKMHLMTTIAAAAADGDDDDGINDDDGDDDDDDDGINDVDDDDGAVG